MGLVNTVVPLDRLEEETVAVVPRDARALPLRAAPARRRASTRTRTASPASSSSPTTRTSSSTPPRRPGRAARPTRRSARPTSRSSRSGRRLQPSRAHLAHGRAAADAARGRRPGARRHRAGDPRRRVPRRWRSSPRCSARSSSRSGRTSPTTTPTPAAAPTPRTASGPVRVTAGGLVPPRQVLVATYVDVRAGGARRPVPRRRRRARVLLIGAASILAGVLYTGGPRPVRLRGPGRGVRLPVLRHRRGRPARTTCRPRSCRGRRSSLAVPVGLLAAAILVVNNVRDLETDRRAGKRTLAVRLGRERTRDALRGDRRRRVRVADRRRWRIALVAVGAAAAAQPAARRPGRAARCASTPTGPTLNEALARTGMVQLVFCVLLVRGNPRWPEHAGRDRAAELPLPGAAPHELRRRCASARRSCCRSTDADGVTGRGEAAPLSPTTASRSHAVERALTRYRPRARAAPTSSAAPRVLDALPARSPTLPQALAAVDMALWDRAGRREGSPGRRAARRRRRVARVPVNATIGAEDRAGAARDGRGGGRERASRA